ncbi:hypothetical protein EVAR_32285_1 [Eumeta japonica]|uniref:Uncharacterized protein n=1 Tax=Eumeta variegata TaxID=151549 RepID=A0A4C1WDG4_EUMVA|nr:hypothetical protein EVAR_32285_1 [Eumeta japonica]
MTREPFTSTTATPLAMYDLILIRNRPTEKDNRKMFSIRVNILRHLKINSFSEARRRVRSRNGGVTRRAKRFGKRDAAPRTIYSTPLCLLLNPSKIIFTQYFFSKSPLRFDY